MERFYKVDLPVPCDELPAGGSAGNLISFQECLDSFCDGETLESFTCGSCKETTHASSQRQLSFNLTGEVMVFFMKWFVNVKTGNTIEIQKIKSRLTGYMTIKIPGQTSKYGLCGIVFHRGRTTNQGHFICVGRASSCVARKCTGMVNATQTCEHHGWWFWNDREVTGPSCLVDAIRKATDYSSTSLGTDSHPILNSETVVPAMLFYTRLAEDDDSEDSLVPRWALCNRGDTWREGI